MKYSKQNIYSSSVLNYSQTAIFYVVQKITVYCADQTPAFISYIYNPFPTHTIPVHRIDTFQDKYSFVSFFLLLPCSISVYERVNNILKWWRKIILFIFIKNNKRFPHHMVLLSVYTVKHVTGNYEWKDNKMVFDCLSKTCTLPTFLSSIILS